MNNKPSTKVRRRQNSNYHCGHPNNAKGRARKSDGGYHQTAMNRHGKAHSLLGLYLDIQRGTVQP